MNHAPLKQRCQSACVTVGLSILGCGAWVSGVNAGEPLALLTSSAYQDSIALGTVVAVQGQQLIFEPQSIVMGDRLPQRLTLTFPKGEKAASLNTGYFAVQEQPENLSPGDFVILPLLKEKGQYQLVFGAFEVDSLDMTQARILSGPLHSNNWAFNWVVNSCGQESEFAFDHSESVQTDDITATQAFVRRDGEQVPIGFKKDHRWKRTDQPLPCQPRSNAGWWQSLLQRVGF